MECKDMKKIYLLLETDNIDDVPNLRYLANKHSNVEFVLISAEVYKVPTEVNRCYFFNPFSVEILRKVMKRIIESYYEKQREIYLFFYYPSDAYIAYLMTVDELNFYDEIECEDLFPGNDPRERILIFQLPDYDNGV